MHEFDFLGELVLIGTMAIVVILVFQRLRIPPVIGLIVTGILLGPSGLGLVFDKLLISRLAELGVVLLLFTIGLEFSIDDLKKLRKIVLVGGFVQIFVTALLIGLLSYLFMMGIGRAITPGAAIFLGFSFSVSSTAICLKILADRDELTLSHGRIALGILIFQDIAIVPMMIAVTLLNPDAVISFDVLYKKIGIIALFATAICTGFRLLMPRMVRVISSLNAREVLVIGALVICFGAAYLTSLIGLSLALGSFVAGMVIASTDERNKINMTIAPFRDAFTSIFFISIGLLLEVRMIDLPFFVGVALIVLLVKGVLVAGVSVMLGNSLRVSIMAGMALAQIGEFSFVLAASALKSSLIDQLIFQDMLAVIVVTMIVTPTMIAIASPFAARVVPALGFIPLASSDGGAGALHLQADNAIICSGKLHAAIIGFGLNGQNVAAVLRATNISYTVLDLDRQKVAAMKKKGEPIHYGDCTEKRSLQRACIDHTRAVVLGIPDAAAIRQSIAIIREINSSAFIIVRARTLDEVDPLYKAGADVVVTEKFETSIQIFSQLLKYFTVAPELILQQQEIIRRECEKIFPQSTDHGT